MSSSIGGGSSVGTVSPLDTVHVAARDGDTERILQHVDTLEHEHGLNSFITLNQRDGPCNQFPLHVACEAGNIDVVELLLQGYRGSLNAPDAFSATPLHLAAVEGHADIVTLLLRMGAVVDAADTQGDTAMHWAASKGKTEIVLLLANSREPPLLAPCGPSGWTPLHRASVNGHWQTVEALLGLGAPSDCRNADGNTPLHLACFANQVPTAESLLAYGAGLDVVNAKGLTPLQLCSSHAAKELLAEHAARVEAREAEKREALEQLQWEKQERAREAFEAQQKLLQHHKQQQAQAAKEQRQQRRARVKLPTDGDEEGEGEREEGDGRGSAASPFRRSMAEDGGASHKWKQVPEFPDLSLEEHPDGDEEDATAVVRRSMHRKQSSRRRLHEALSGALSGASLGRESSATTSFLDACLIEPASRLYNSTTWQQYQGLAQQAQQGLGLQAEHSTSSFGIGGEEDDGGEASAVEAERSSSGGRGLLRRSSGGKATLGAVSGGRSSRGGRSERSPARGDRDRSSGGDRGSGGGAAAAAPATLLPAASNWAASGASRSVYQRLTDDGGGGGVASAAAAARPSPAFMGGGIGTRASLPRLPSDAGVLSGAGAGQPSPSARAATQRGAAAAAAAAAGARLSPLELGFSDHDGGAGDRGRDRLGGLPDACASPPGMPGGGGGSGARRVSLPSGPATRSSPSLVLGGAKRDGGPRSGRLRGRSSDAGGSLLLPSALPQAPLSSPSGTPSPGEAAALLPSPPGKPAGLARRSGSGSAAAASSASSAFLLSVFPDSYGGVCVVGADNYFSSGSGSGEVSPGVMPTLHPRASGSIGMPTRPAAAAGRSQPLLSVLPDAGSPRAPPAGGPWPAAAVAAAGQQTQRGGSSTKLPQLSRAGSQQPAPPPS